MQRYPMTVVGEKKLREELERLKSVERPRVIKDIAVAREHGDLKENAEYHAAREEQGFIEALNQDIEGKLSRSQVIDITTIPYTGKVLFGTTVRIINTETDEEVEYLIVGEDEADIKQNRLSVSSLIARAVIGKEEVEVISIRFPRGVVEYEIDEVKHI